MTDGEANLPIHDGRDDIGLFAFLLPSHQDLEGHGDGTSGVGQVTVRAQIQAITVACEPSGSVAFG